MTRDNLLAEMNKTQHPGFAHWIFQNISGEVLDLGCGNKWYHPFIKGTIVSVDAFPRSAPDYLLNIGKESLPLLDDTFDFALMIDVLEHLHKPEAVFALKEAQRVAREVLILTPAVWTDNTKVTFDPDSFYYMNPYNLHRGLYSPADFPVASGWELIKEVFPPEEYCFYRWRKANAN